MLKAVLTMVAVLISATVAQAAPIATVIATTTAPTLLNADPIQKTVDLLNGNLSGNTFSDVTVPSNGWYNDGNLNSLPVVIDYDLSGSFLLSRLAFWNVVSDGLGFNVFGFRDVVVESSTDGVLYTPLTGAAFTPLGVHTFAQAIDSFGTSAEVVNFNPVVASFVRFTVQSNYSADDFAGYNTVMFDGLAVPGAPELDPQAATLPLCFMSLLMLSGVTRRKEARQA